MYNSLFTTTQFKLNYFPIRFRGEPIRMVFTQAGVPFEDIRVKFEDWPEMKPKMPMGSLPVLVDDDGNTLCQTRAICAYVAGRFNMNGKDSFESAQCSMYAGGAEDLLTAMSHTLLCKDQEQKEKLYEEVLEKNVEPFFEQYDGFLTENDSGFLVGTGVSWADFFVYNAVTIVLQHGQDQPNTDDYPNLKAFLDKIENLPKIKEYLEKRPHSDV